MITYKCFVRSKIARDSQRRAALPMWSARRSHLRAGNTLVLQDTDHDPAVFRLALRG